MTKTPAQLEKELASARSERDDWIRMQPSQGGNYGRMQVQRLNHKVARLELELAAAKIARDIAVEEGDAPEPPPRKEDPVRRAARSAMERLRANDHASRVLNGQRLRTARARAGQIPIDDYLSGRDLDKDS